MRAKPGAVVRVWFGTSVNACSIAPAATAAGPSALQPPANPVVSERLIRLRRALADQKDRLVGLPLGAPRPTATRSCSHRQMLPRSQMFPVWDQPWQLGSAEPFFARSRRATLRWTLRKMIQRLRVLTEWRAGVAREMGVPPFLVVRDAVLRDIVTARPESRMDLARIRGVGPGFWPSLPMTSCGCRVHGALDLASPAVVLRHKRTQCLRRTYRPRSTRSRR